MVKIIRFFCIVGIVGLLALFISYTEIEPTKEVEKKLSEIEKIELLEDETIKVETESAKTSIGLELTSLL